MQTAAKNNFMDKQQKIDRLITQTGICLFVLATFFLIVYVIINENL